MISLVPVSPSSATSDIYTELMKFIAINATDAAHFCVGIEAQRIYINDLRIHASQKLPIWQIRSANIETEKLRL